ncbi:glutaredoxin domain-containing protein [Pseudoclavibacter sp. RFBB5]|uniref:glutaredoxin domain-containing protein n=1 Tax=Pseudoclavibacter sp. RFBB5 TaxID=2080574 RepID=UPI001CA4EF6C|nr:glutaredoxin domain-containing protein [Pseudoclavibacter sp. RFBB5]
MRVYTTGERCVRCKLTKKAMAAKGVEFVEVDVTLDENAAARSYIMDELGYSEAPVVVVDDEDHWSGFRPDQINRLAKRVSAHVP